MKKEKRHISIEWRLIIGIIIAILISASLLYIYHNYWEGRFIVNNVPTSMAGVGIIILISLSFCAIFILVMTLLVIRFPVQSESEKQIKKLPHNFVNVHFKDFDNFTLSKFVSSEDITCFAKLDEDGKVVYSLQLNVELNTDDYELFLQYFEI